MKTPPTSNYDFERLITDGCAYVDKTDTLWWLASKTGDAIYFIARPRRFGKSLMLSTLKCMFEGRKELFKGLAIEKRPWDWSVKWPVIDLNMSDFDKEGTLDGFRYAIGAEMRERLSKAGVPFRKDDPPAKLFDALIKGLAAASPQKKVVVLVDEYDHPLGGLLDDRRALRAMRRELHGFYSTLKNNVGAIRFLMMTGVSKFTKLSVFSGLNNLTDLTMDEPKCASLLGYTRKEIETTLAPNLAAFARKMRCTREEALHRLLAWYDSYRFSPYSNVRVLNPVSVGRALPSGILTDYWSKTGLPTLIVERLQAFGKMPSDLGDVETTPSDLDVCDAEELPWVSLLYQSGYLTIKKVLWKDDRDGRRVGRLILGVPNMEVRENLKSNFWRTVMRMDESAFVSLVDVAKRQLAVGDVDSLVNETLFSLYAKIPPTWRVKDEADAKRHFLLFAQMLGAKLQTESASARGNADAIIETRKGVWVFEFKFNRTARAAIRQIREKGYADAYKADKRPVTIVGINFTSKKRNIDEPIIEPL